MVLLLVAFRLSFFFIVLAVIAVCSSSLFDFPNHFIIRGCVGVRDVMKNNHYYYYHCGEGIVNRKFK